jgi:hypothetical protein
MILYIITTDNRIETFDSIAEVRTTINAPNITDDNKVEITSQQNASIVNSSPIITVNARESLDINGFVLESINITSSYKIEDTSKTIASLFKINPPASGVKLISPNLYTDDGTSAQNIKSGFPTPINFYNYISFVFAKTNIKAKTIELTYTSYELFNSNDFKTIYDKPQLDIRIYTGDTNQYKLLGIQSSFTNTTTTLTFNIDNNDNDIKSKLSIFFSSQIKSINLTKIRINIDQIAYTEVKYTDKDIIKFSTSNPAEQIVVPPLYGSIDPPEPQSTSTPLSNYQRLNNLFKFNTPWAIYDGKNYNSSRGVIPELLNRECKNAIVTGKNASIIQEGSISYLSGTTETQVEFPEYSLPQFYTICAITKYTNKDPNMVSSRGRILTSESHHNPNWLLGHWAGVTGVMHNNGWRTDSSTSLSNNKNEWVVSCVKSHASSTTTTDNTILFNGNKRAIANTTGGAINNYSSASKKVVINKSLYGEFSDFGLSYIIIWDNVLSDNQLKLVSDTLIEYLNTGTDLNLSGININLNDGSTREKAAVSAVAIKKLTCTNKNGLYWILPKNGNTANAKQIYCIMDDNFSSGGGWMLALKGAKNSSEFVFNSSRWTTDNVLNDTLQNHDAFTDAKYDIYNYYEAKECCAIFDKNDTNGELTYPDKPEYGYIWYATFNGGSPISLLNFYTPINNRNKSSYVYTSQNGNFNYVKKWMLDRGLLGTYILYSYFISEIVDVDCKKKSPLNRKMFSHQEAFKAFGFNVIPTNWNHAVRWGATYNENTGPSDGLPNTNDVSCGIGLQNRNYSAGDAIGCCQSTAGTNASMGFKWFIR